MIVPHSLASHDRRAHERRRADDVGAIDQLVAGVTQSDMRSALARGLAGDISPALALMQLLVASEDADAVRLAIDDVVQRAASQLHGDHPLVRDRADEMASLVASNARGCSRVAAMLRRNVHSPGTASSIDEAIALCARAFDSAVHQSEEASVALYSLGSPAILAQATREIVDLLDRWGVLGTERDILQIGCGIGRMEAALAPRVRWAYGIDVSGEMIRAARRRCAGLDNVSLSTCSGRDLAGFADASLDLVYAVDTFPYLQQAGASLVRCHFAEAARVLRDGGDFVILNYSYRGDLAEDERDVRELAREHGFAVSEAGASPFTVWDGRVFRLRKG